jgi:hypothetical protein
LCCLLFWLSETDGFSGTVQYMTSLGAPMPMLAAIIAVVMEVPAHSDRAGLFHPPSRGALYFIRWERR